MGRLLNASKKGEGESLECASEVEGGASEKCKEIERVQKRFALYEVEDSRRKRRLT